MRSATRSADMPGPGRRFGHEVTMRQRRVWAVAMLGAASVAAARGGAGADQFPSRDVASWLAPGSFCSE